MPGSVYRIIVPSLSGLRCFFYFFYEGKGCAGQLSNLFHGKFRVGQKRANRFFQYLLRPYLGYLFYNIHCIRFIGYTINLLLEDTIIFRFLKADVVLNEGKNTLNLLFFKAFAIQMSR